MLLQFNCENFRSIKDSCIISFAASKDTEKKECLLHPDGKRRLLPVIAVYGANAAGKSNVIDALSTMKKMVAGPWSRLSKGEAIPWEPFADSEEPTAFEVVFYTEGIKYCYGFSFSDSGIHSEYLYHWPNGREALIFSREENHYEFRENISEQLVLSKRTPCNRLYLSSSNDWNLPQTEKPYRWFFDGLNILNEERELSEKLILDVIQNDDQKLRILKELMAADLGICDISLLEAGKRTEIVTTHRRFNEENQEVLFKLKMEQESAGTRQYFFRIGTWLKALDEGSLIVVDEIEKSLHPLLSRRLVELIQSDNLNNKGAQLLFTTHDAQLMDLELLRRDQVWFVEKNDKTCMTEAYPLTSFSPRKGENIRKGYLQGRFGAIPFLNGAK